MRIRVGWLVGSIAIASLVTGACAKPRSAQLPTPREVLDYRLERGDVLGIRVFDAPELDQQVPIRPDGRISVAPLRDLQAAGLTIEELDTAITEGLAQYFKEARVTVFVREFANRNVYVGGEVDHPGLVPLQSGMTSVMAIFHAGGFRETAQTTNVVVLREGEEGKEEVIEINLKRVLNDALPDLVLEPYDVVFVPKSKIASVNLFVEQYIKRVLPLSLMGSANYTRVEGTDSSDDTTVIISR
jgi:protein involved in polysaccharide export with SLBB domain